MVQAVRRRPVQRLMGDKHSCGRGIRHQLATWDIRVLRLAGEGTAR
ncbi:hypothetical protein T261_08970 [Streptomyces lydicus]|nr:hypothetical protein T261_0045 [Streptomyces lydicus]AQY20688.1 hypothetical protein T261_08970 [Streptomyces lydicus]